MNRRFPPIFLICLLIASTGHTAVRRLGVSWIPNQTQNIILAGFRLYDSNKTKVCESNNPSLTQMKCDVDVIGNQATFTLTSYTADGRESPHSEPYTIKFVPLPQAVIHTITSVDSLTVKFDGSSSIGTITKYTWNFNDGSAPNHESVINHTFPAGGSYNISLSIEDFRGAMSTTSRNIQIAEPTKENIPPTARLSNSTPTIGSTPLRVSFDASASSDLDNDPLIFRWDFGDGRTHMGTDKLVSHEYFSVGTFTVTVTVSDPSGKSDSNSLPVIVKPAETIGIDSQPTALILSSILSGKTPLLVMLDGSNSSASEQGGAIQQYAWNFGDGTIGQGRIVAHTFIDPGTYTVSLTVIDTSGKIAKKNITIRGTETEEPPTNLQYIYQLLLLTKESLRI